MEATDPSFAPRLRELRATAGLSQEGLAEAAGLSQGTVSALERGAYDASWPTVKKLATALGVDCTAFTGEDGPAAAAPARNRGRPKTKPTAYEFDVVGGEARPAPPKGGPGKPKKGKKS